MSDQFNPYQLPVSGSLSNNPYGNGGRSCWAEGKHLVMPLGQSVLPLRCIRCNAPAEEPIKNRVFCWHHPAWYLLTFVVIYPVIALFIRKKVYVQAGLCAEHQRKRTRAIFICRLVFFAGIMAMIFSSGIAQDADFVFMTLCL